MRLSDLPASIGLDVARDAEFDSLGLLSDDAPRMLAGLYDVRFLARECLPNPHIACVITSRHLASAIPERMGLGLADDPKASFYAVHDYLRASTNFYWSDDFESVVSPDARVHPAAWVAPRNVRIGRRAVIEPSAVILERSILGDEVVIRAGTVIGAEGFEPKEIGGAFVIVGHEGGVLIRDRVEIQSGSVVCRAVFNGFTEIGEDSKLGAQVGVSHNVRIGRRCRIAPGAQLTGSVRVGDDVWIGPAATVSSGLRVGDGARVSIGAVVVRDVGAGATVSGNFAMPHKAFLALRRRSLRQTPGAD